MSGQSTWRDHLTRYTLFDKKFIDRWGDQPWPLHDDPNNADDIISASELHLQLVSRIATQRLAYNDGLEAAALKSVYELFGEARDIFARHPRCRLTDAVCWYVINTHVRPFTAKWHRQSERGALFALDATDVFRQELSSLQRRLAHFDALLVEIRDGYPPPLLDIESVDGDREKRVAEEMKKALPWGIDPKLGGLAYRSAEHLNGKEKDAIRDRRRYYQGRLNSQRWASAINGAIENDAAKASPCPPAALVGPYAAEWVDRAHATGLAISGGGIRSATFALGVLVALARRNLLFQFDYLSTVSGGGYLGSFLSTFLNGEEPKAKEPAHVEQAEIGLLRDDLPFRRRDGEAAALRYVRHHSKYLVTGRLWERLQMAFTQIYGMTLNGFGFAYLALVAAIAEFTFRQSLPIDSLWLTGVSACVVIAGAAFLASMVAHRSPKMQSRADTVMTAASLGLVGLLFWKVLSYLHLLDGASGMVIASAAAIPLISSGILVVIGDLPKPLRILLIALSAFAAPIVFFGIEANVYASISKYNFTPLAAACLIIVTTIVAPAIFWLCFDINFTSPHRYYRRKLSEAYLVQLDPTNNNEALLSSVSTQMSKCAEKGRAPYHLINCALNVPASNNPAMQGRLTDFFLFSPHFSGSPLLDYTPTSLWEDSNPILDLGTAMAISGAAAAPQMGTGTMRNISFWLALFNVRLGYWIRNPKVRRRGPETPPGLFYLLQEMFGWANEKRAYLNLSDGGHIENLGIYELLRRRCKFIVAIDGEQDPEMTFQGLTTLQRLAYIDLGVTIDAGLDALRLGDKGVSNSHFAFCRIRYPSDSRDGPESFGYLIYLKLSLTGNEGEFIRRYRLDEPAFPHHSTADQFFTEAQFEAYRSLGEHVGDKMFLPAIVGPAIAGSNDIELEKWFVEIGKNMLEPLPESEAHV